MHTGFIEQKKNSIRKAVLSAIIGFIILSVVYHIILFHDMAVDKERYSYIARNQAEHIITTIDCVMSRTNTLKTMVKENDGDTAWFDNVAEDLYTAVKDETGVRLKNFAIAPNGVVSNVYPFEGNEKLIGFDFMDTSREGNLEAIEAYKHNKTIITNPFELIQGGIGMGGRAAVFLQNDDPGSFWGLVTVTIDFDNLMLVTGLDNLKGMGVDYSLSYIDDDGKAKFMYGMSDLGDNAVKTHFNVRNLIWELSVEPSNGWFSVTKGIISTLIIIVFSCLSGIIIYMMLRLRESNALLLKMSTTDVLTGCYNRRAYEEKMSELSLQKIDDDFVYVSADINGLKHTNDTLGHSAGDELISGATLCMNEGFGAYGSIYRIGGDEFVALIYANEETLHGIIENLNSIIDSWKGHNVEKISLSIGYASHREFPDMTIDDLAKCSDMKMYEAKSEYYQKHDRRRR